MNIDSGDTPLVLPCPAWKNWSSEEVSQAMEQSPLHRRFSMGFLQPRHVPARECHLTTRLVNDRQNASAIRTVVIPYESLLVAVDDEPLPKGATDVADRNGSVHDRWVPVVLLLHLVPRIPESLFLIDRQIWRCPALAPRTTSAGSKPRRAGMAAKRRRGDCRLPMTEARASRRAARTGKARSTDQPRRCRSPSRRTGSRRAV